jgi:hypothetical protein
MMGGEEEEMHQGAFGREAIVRETYEVEEEEKAPEKVEAPNLVDAIMNRCNDFMEAPDVIS